MTCEWYVWRGKESEREGERASEQASMARERDGWMDTNLRLARVWKSKTLVKINICAHIQ